MTTDNNLRAFCEKHSIRVLDTNKRAHPYHKVNLNYFRDPGDFNIVQHELVDLSEPLYTVEIAESELNRIADFELQVFNNMKQTGHYNMFEVLMKQKEHEKYLKNKYPAVKKAYEQYSLMLKLAESGEL
jgi:hypothetical protein